MRKYKHVLFDLDQTLWDFDRCSAETINEIFAKYGLAEYLKCDCVGLVDKFMTVNSQLWNSFSQGLISNSQLRHQRFRLIFEELGAVIKDEVVEAITDYYLAICPRKGHLIPNALKVLDYLKDKYEIHILTNGFEDIQYLKIHHSGIADYFKEIITSETMGFKKPDKEIFHYTLNKIKCKAANCIMVGDSLEADILGARNSNIDHVFYNPSSIKYSVNVTYEIKCLSELQHIL